MTDKPSYVHGVGLTPLKSETIGTALEQAAAEHGGRLALICRHQAIRWSYAELDARARTRWRRGFWRWGWSPATASASGRPIAPNGR